ncbi:MAG: dihydrodipicolinate synthase family protein [Gemmatimonadetes bacterium]|nr:dihydrodipicolinate synthase family protein [Gemmatimonadota bacterium]MYF18211.1 dihydrodipicolinate synthase family protein [Gemmatimonadota bacterium]
MASVTFKGVFPILVTPFDDYGNLDLESFDRTVRFMADIGVNGVTIIGVLGESNRMLDAEREQLIKTAVGAAGGRIPVIVGTSYSGTRATLELSRMAESLAAAGVMVTPARESVPNEDRIFEFFQQVAEGISIPIVVQDHPASTQVHMSVPFILRLVREIPLVACIKEEAVPTPPRITALLDGIGDRAVTILTGLGALYGAFDLTRGAHGFMTGFAFPEVLLALVRSAENRDFDTVHDIYHRYLPLIVYEQQPGVAIRKEIFRLRGLIASSYVRHPGANIDPTTADHLKSLLRKMLPGADITRPIEV